MDQYTVGMYTHTAFLTHRHFDNYQDSKSYADAHEHHYINKTGQHAVIQKNGIVSGSSS